MHLRSVGWVALAVLMWVPAAFAAQPQTSPAVPLFAPPMRAPVEVAGTGLAPEVNIRVTIGVDGKVSHAEMVSIEPSTEFDAIFARVVTETLGQWRYFPAQQDGQPIEAHLEWKVKFPAVLESEQDDPSVDLGWRHLAPQEDNADDFRKRILALPQDQRATMLTASAASANECLRSGEIGKFSTPRFMVYTDAPNAESARVLANNLEATFNSVTALIGDGVPPQPEPYRVVVFLYASEANFNELKRRVQTFEWAAGFYSPLGMLAFHMQMPSNESLTSLMLHEAVHAYIDRYLSRPGIAFPSWLDEGLAEYVGNSQIKKGKLIPGKTRTAEVYRTPWGAFMGVSSTRTTIGDIRDAIRHNTALTIAEVIESDRSTFYGKKREQFYPMSWLLVHFLRHGRPEWDSDRFGRLILYVAEGYSAAAAFRQIYGDPVELESEFRDYVKKL